MDENYLLEIADAMNDHGESDCTICHGTKKYINARGVNSGDPCNVCDPEGWDKFLREKGIR